MSSDLSEIIETSFSDIAEDLEIYLYLVNDANQKLHINIDRISKISQAITPQGKTVYQDLTKSLIRQIDNIFSSIIKLQCKIKTTNHSGDSLKQLIIDSYAVYESIRLIYGTLGGTITATDWQSPSYNHSLFPMAGRLTGKISPTINDYKRDQHLDTGLFEQKFLAEYIDAITKFPIHISATHTGMAAFTTILNFLIMEKKINGYVIVGKNIYFEAKEMLKSTFGDKYIEVDENDTDGVSGAIHNYKPTVLFFDTIGNSPSMPILNLDKIMENLKKEVKGDIYVVLDNTSAGITFQPVKRYYRPLSKIHLIVYESLNKFYQFGMDRVFGGILWGYGKDTVKLFDYRVHLGTIISDSAVMTIPTPNRKMLELRMGRLTRNTLMLSELIQNRLINSKKSYISKIVFPGLINHPSNAWAEQINMSGAFFMLEFKPQFRKIKIYQNMVNKILMTAQKDNIQIIAGTSFGLPITRIYLTALHAILTTKPFIRISPGTESVYDIHRLAGCINDSIT
jgi:cystathionine beta-lyase/cystathionine gamma-synthase